MKTFQKCFNLAVDGNFLLFYSSCGLALKQTTNDRDPYERQFPLHSSLSATASRSFNKHFKPRKRVNDEAKSLGGSWRGWCTGPEGFLRKKATRNSLSMSPDFQRSFLASTLSRIEDETWKTLGAILARRECFPLIPFQIAFVRKEFSVSKFSSVFESLSARKHVAWLVLRNLWDLKFFKARICKCRRDFFAPPARITASNFIKSDFCVKSLKIFPTPARKSSIKISWHEGVVEIPCRILKSQETKRKFFHRSPEFDKFSNGFRAFFFRLSHDSCGNSSTFLIHPLLYGSSQANAAEDEKKFFLIRIPLLSIACDSFCGILIADSSAA